MSISASRSRAVVVLAAASLATMAALPASADHHPDNVQHVLLLSVDGLHQQDLAWYVAHHPGSALARLAGGGVQFTNASTPIVSDSFPGMVGQVTGGDPGVTGVYYDDS
ncbi:MAG TPA: alkaline phosphatase family protein, partial [Pseudonocardiaceae bacterium]